MPKPPSLPELFAARLVQARDLRGLSQRALGDRAGLGKATGSTRINRYERGVSSPGLAGLEALAATLEVPAAFLLAESEAVANAILALASLGPRKQGQVGAAIQALTEDEQVLALVLRLAAMTEDERTRWLRELGAG